MSQKIALIDFGFTGFYYPFLMKLLHEKGVSIDLYTYNNYEEKPKYVENVFKIKTPFKPKNIFKLIELDKEISALTKDKNYDYIYSDVMYLSNAVNCFHSGTVIQKNEIFYPKIFRIFHFLGHLPRIIFVRNFLKKTPKTIVVSSIMKEDYSKNANIPKETIKVIFPGYQFNHEAIVENNFKSEQFTIGISANGFETKGGFVLLSAMKNLIKKYPNIKAKIIYPKYKTNFGAKMYIFWNKLNKNVEILPYQKDMAMYYKQLNCLVCPSLFEPFGRVVTEAMNFKVPVIVGSMVGAKDIIEHKENGLIFEMGKNAGKNLAEQIEYLIKNPDFVASSVEKAYLTAQKYSWENFANELFKELYP